jgi:hypothetical protein
MPSNVWRAVLLAIPPVWLRLFLSALQWQSLSLDLSLDAGPSRLKSLKSKKKKVAERVGFEGRNP